jgi:hypothetical protein
VTRDIWPPGELIEKAATALENDLESKPFVIFSLD